MRYCTYGSPFVPNPTVSLELVVSVCLLNQTKHRFTFIPRNNDLEHTELLADVGETLGLLRLVANDVESHSLRQRSTCHSSHTFLPALTNRHDITLLHIETRRTVSRDVTMSLFVTNRHLNTSILPSVLLDITEIVTTNNDGALHLGGNHQTLQNSSTNGNRGSERTLLIDVLSVNSSLRGLDAQTHISVPTLVGLLTKEMDLAVREHFLLLEGSLVLQSIKIVLELSTWSEHLQNALFTKLIIHINSNLLAPEYQPSLFLVEKVITKRTSQEFDPGGKCITPRNLTPNPMYPFCIPNKQTTAIQFYWIFELVSISIGNMTLCSDAPT